MTSQTAGITFRPREATICVGETVVPSSGLDEVAGEQVHFAGGLDGAVRAQARRR